MIRNLHIKAALALVSLLWIGSAYAQMSIKIDFEESGYIRYQDIIGTITITNRAGRDFILDGPSGASWLTFEMTDPNSNMMGLKRSSIKIEPLLVRRGETITKTFPLSKLYHLDKYGIYGVIANVYYPPNKTYIRSKRKTLNISDGKVFWEEVIGVPKGLTGEGGHRKISLLTHQDKDKTKLFMRFTDTETTRVLGTRFLGTILKFKDPQIAIDSDNRINVLFLSAPKTWYHTIALSDGSVMKPDIYREDKTNRPSMLLSETGKISIHGGFYYGGSKLVGAPSSLNPNSSTKRRDISERPTMEGELPPIPRAEPMTPRAQLAE